MIKYIYLMNEFPSFLKEMDTL